MDIKTSLLRERFILRNDAETGIENSLSITAPSNRMQISLTSGTLEPEVYVVRTHNVHVCTRMVAEMIYDYSREGPLLHRVIPYKWEDVWDKVTNEYEQAYNPQRWIAVYHKGKPIFDYGERHLFLDMIEKFDAQSAGDYDSSLKVAEQAFQKAGKPLKIDYESNVALIANIERLQARCGMILRGPEKTTTFNFHIESPSKARPVDASQCLRVCSALLEGIQLAFLVGFNHEKLRIGMIGEHSHEGRQTREARRRLGRLNAEINGMEGVYKVRYRPERPEFNRIVLDSEKLARKILEQVTHDEAASHNEDNGNQNHTSQ